MAEGSVPENVDEILQQGIFVPQESISPEAMVVYERMLQGECMHCESQVGDETVIIVNRLGVVQLFCGVVCLQDWFNMHWMMEQYDDFVEKAKFRNQKGNN